MAIIAYSKPGLMLSLKAAASMSGKQFFLVKPDSTEGSFALNAAATTFGLGVLQDEPASGATGCIQYTGISKVEAGGTIAVGDVIVSDANGAGVASTAAAGTNNWAYGVALTSCASGEVFSMMILIHRVQGA